MFPEYDVIVVGGGHAGCEAAAVCARLGHRTLLITMDLTRIAQMSCNPAMGGIAKGQIVREIDALGGFSGIVSDISMVQFHMLNRSKGPAMWSPRTQNDRMLFSQTWRQQLEAIPTLDFWQDMVVGLLIRDKTVYGVKTRMGYEIHSKIVILTTGTFLNGVIHIGEKQFRGGRIGEPHSWGLTEQLRELGFETSRLKTGTPPRIDGRTVDFSQMEEQKGDDPPRRFSHLKTPLPNKQLSCWLTATTPRTHAILKEGFDRSPLFTGRIKGLGPRYCPSIEDKLVRFPDKPSHQLFLEPEGWRTTEMYLNGFSTSLPAEIQFRALRTIPGLENAKMLRPGYAIEYDFFQPTQLHPWLETIYVRNLFFAGQINGTTGYEEAACQGLIAGINAHLRLRDEEPLVLTRAQAYIGVLIDDLVTKGVDEPYRMFTSRSEYRLMLRQDNADVRLTPIAAKLGLAEPERIEGVRQKQEALRTLRHLLETISVEPAEINQLLEAAGTSPIRQKTRLIRLFHRPEVDLDLLMQAKPSLREQLRPFPPEAIEYAWIELKYEPYIQKDRERIARMNQLEDIPLRPDIDYWQIPNLSYEAREKLSRIRPRTLGQASRIPGVSPADIMTLLIALRQGRIPHHPPSASTTNGSSQTATTLNHTNPPAHIHSATAEEEDEDDIGLTRCGCQPFRC